MHIGGGECDVAEGGDTEEATVFGEVGDLGTAGIGRGGGEAVVAEAVVGEEDAAVAIAAACATGLEEGEALAGGGGKGFGVSACAVLVPRSVAAEDGTFVSSEGAGDDEGIWGPPVGCLAHAYIVAVAQEAGSGFGDGEVHLGMFLDRYEDLHLQSRDTAVEEEHGGIGGIGNAGGVAVVEAALDAGADGSVVSKCELGTVA